MGVRRFLALMLVAAAAACGGPAAPGDQCTVDEDCRDGIPCTIDRCQDGACVAEPDDSACGTPEACDAMVCNRYAGCVVVVDESNVPEPEGDAACAVGECRGGLAVTVRDDSVCAGVSGMTASCVVEACDPAGQNTDDGSGCRIGFSDHACDDDNPCTDDLCAPDDLDADPDSGCVYSAVDGDVSGDLDGLPCTTASCDAGELIETPDDALCDDGLGCTVDACYTDFGCYAYPDDSLCNPGERCDSAQDAAANPSGCVAFDTCPPTLAAYLDDSVYADTTGLADDSAPSCSDSSGGHPDLAFGFSLAEDTDLTITLTADDAHLVSLALVPVVDGACGEELACDAPGDTTATLHLVGLAAGDYAVIVDGDGDTLSEGPSYLSITLN